MFSFIAACLSGLATHAQTTQWAAAFGSAQIDDAHAIAVDASGNTYSTGYYRGTVDFDPGPGTASLTSLGNEDVYILKQNPSGELIWVKSVGGPNVDRGGGIAVDANGNVYVAGFFAETADFDPGSGSYPLVSAGNTDTFVLKLNASGDFLWAGAFAGIDLSYGLSINLDADANVYTTGSFLGTADFDPGAGVANVVPPGGYATFVQKMDSEGNYLWAKAFGGTYNLYEHVSAVDGAGNIYTTGSFDFPADFDPGASTVTLTSVGGADVYVQKMDTDGNFLWARSFGGTYGDAGSDVTADASGVVTTGFFMQTTDFDPGAGSLEVTANGTRDVFVQKMDPDGNFLWAKTFGGTGYDQGTELTLDASSNVYTTGYFSSSVDIDPGSGTQTLTSVGAEDLFIQKLDTDGNFIWASSLGGISTDGGNAIAVSPTGQVQVSGFFSDTVDFAFGATTQNFSSAGLLDVFVMQILQPDLNTETFATDHTLTAYPNPNQGVFQISTVQPLSQVHLTLSDLQGKTIFSRDYEQLTQASLEINGESGVYFLKIEAAEGQFVRKLIKR